MNKWRNLVRNKGKRPDGVRDDDVVRFRAPHEHRWSESCTAEICNWNPDFHYQLLVRTPAEPDVLREALADHFPTGLRQKRYEIATTKEPVEGSITCECYCGESFVGTDEQEVRQLWAEHAALAATEPTTKEVM